MNTKNRIIIGLVGTAGAGKDSLSNHLVNHFDGVATAMFAGPLKELCCEQFGYDFDRLADLDYKEEQDPNLPAGWTRRRVLQHVGTEGFRAIDPDFWVKRAMAVALSMLCHDEIEVVIFTDVRFQNEADAIRKAGGYLWRIERLYIDGHAAIQGEAAAAHASETELASIQADLTMSAEFGKLVDLYAQGNMAARQLGLRVSS